MSEMEWKGVEGEYSKEKFRTVITRLGYKNFERQMKQDKISQILMQNIEVQEAYGKWRDKVFQIKKRVEIEVKNKTQNRYIRQLLRIKRKVKYTTGEMRNSRIKLLNTHIQRNTHREKVNRIKRTVEELRRAG